MSIEKYVLVYVVHGQMHYTLADSDAGSNLSKVGWLEPGHIVRLEQAPTADQIAIPGFVEGVGIIEADARHLRRS